MLPLSPAKNRYMFWPSAIRVWSIGPVPEPEMLPVNSGCGADQPLGLVGSLGGGGGGESGAPRARWARTPPFVRGRKEERGAPPRGLFPPGRAGKTKAAVA